jgi:hypothetical protein
MKSKIKTFLVKSLIESDFLLLENVQSKNLKHFQSEIQSKSFTNTISSLELFQLTKTIKQFIRALQFLKSRKKRHLHILLENQQYIELIELFFKEKDINCSYSVKSNLVGEKEYRSCSQLFLTLDSTLKNNKNIFRRFFESNIFLVQKINSSFEKKNWGSYKIYNNIVDYKKILFLIILVHKVLTQK